MPSINDSLWFAGMISGYKPADQDAPNENGKYYNGYLDPDGNWYIMQTTISGSVSSYRYFKGASDYAANWTNRTTLAYSTFDAIF